MGNDKCEVEEPRTTITTEPVVTGANTSTRNGDIAEAAVAVVIADDKVSGHAVEQNDEKRSPTLGRQVGVMVVASPGNPRPSWLHARDYGVVVTNPFPKQPKEPREPYVKTWIKRGESFTLSYAVLIHDLPADQPLNHEQMAETLLESFDY